MTGPSQPAFDEMFKPPVEDMPHVAPTLQAPRFDGPVYVPEFDQERLTGQLARVFEAMRAGAWLTLREIEEATGDPPASISAQLRHLRKPRFGSHVIEKQHRGPREHGLWEYRLQLPKEPKA